MDYGLSALLEAAGYSREGDGWKRLLLPKYMNDPTSVPTEERQIFDYVIRSIQIPKPKDDEAFRFFLDDQDASD